MSWSARALAWLLEDLDEWKRAGDGEDRGHGWQHSSLRTALGQLWGSRSGM